ncbi:6004_t:CDS:1, partial [Gigaspora rosea]
AINTNKLNSTRAKLDFVKYLLLIILSNTHIHIYLDNLLTIQILKPLQYLEPTQTKINN